MNEIDTLIEITYNLCKSLETMYKPTKVWCRSLRKI